MKMRDTSKCTFSKNNRLIKQIDGCPMRGPIFLSISFAYLYLQDRKQYIGTFETSFLHMVCEWYVCQKKKKSEADELTTH